MTDRVGRVVALMRWVERLPEVQRHRDIAQCARQMRRARTTSDIDRMVSRFFQLYVVLPVETSYSGETDRHRCAGIVYYVANALYWTMMGSVPIAAYEAALYVDGVPGEIVVARFFRPGIDVNTKEIRDARMRIDAEMRASVPGLPRLDDLA